MEALIATIDAALDHTDMPRMIAEALGDEGEAGFNAFVSRVEGRFESSQNYASFVQFVHDHSVLRDDEVVRLFEFIYSSLVNNFKGELAEILARPALREVASRLPEHELILGPRMTAPQLRSDRITWAKGPDALICRRGGPRLQISAIAEIKAMNRSVPAMLRQIAAQLERLHHGLSIDGESVATANIEIREPLMRVLIRPWLRAADGSPVPHRRLADVWLAELPFSRGELTEAAYRFAAWYFGRFGPRVFHLPDDPEPGGRRPVPHPEDSLEANGLNSFIEALYGVGRRGIFEVPDRNTPRGGRRAPGQTWLWLYNSMVQGSADANAQEMYDPPFERNPQHEALWERRELALKEYYEGRFDRAAERMPDPAEEDDQWWRRREWLMVARIHVRLGDTAAAASALSSALAEPATSNRAIPLEIAAIETLIAIADARTGAARVRLEEATSVLETLRAEIRQRNAEQRGFPADVHALTAQTAVYDLAVAAELLGERERIAPLLEGIRGAPEWVATLVRHDPVWEPFGKAWRERMATLIV